MIWLHGSLNSGGIFDLTDKQKELAGLEKEIAAPDFWQNPQQVQKVNQRIAAIKNEVEDYGSLQADIEDLQVLVELAIEEDETGLQTEIENGLETIKTRFDKIELRLMLNGEFDANNAILSIHPGAGGVDAQDWAGMLMRMYLRWCDQREYTTEIIDLTPRRRSWH